MNIVVIVGSLAVVGSFFVAWWAVSSSPRSADLSALGDGGTDLRTRSLQRSPTDRIGTPLLEGLGRLVERWTPHGRVDRLERRLVRAGSPRPWNVERLLGAKMVVAAVFVALTLVVVGVDGAGIVLAAVAGVLGFLVPDAVLNVRGDHRADEVRRDLADVIDQISMMVQAGLGIDAAMARAAASSRGALADELVRVGQDVRVGVDRSVALTNMAERVDVPELGALVAALVQSERVGSPVSTTLRVQADELRIRQRQHAEEKAMKLPVKMLFPLIFCILPVLMIVLLGPAVISIVEQLG